MIPDESSTLRPDLLSDVPIEQCRSPRSAPVSSSGRSTRVRRWKLSPDDLASFHGWSDDTAAEEAMFFHTDTADAPWTVVKSNDKKPEKDPEVAHEADPAVVGAASQLFEHGESADSRPPMR